MPRTDDIHIKVSKHENTYLADASRFHQPLRIEHIHIAPFSFIHL